MRSLNLLGFYLTDNVLNYLVCIGLSTVALQNLFTMNNITNKEMLDAIASELLEIYSLHGVLIQLRDSLPNGSKDRLTVEKAIAIIKPKMDIGETIEKYKFDNFMIAILMNCDLADEPKRKLEQLFMTNK